MQNLAAALAVLFLSHAVPALPPVRAALVRRTGPAVFRAVYSLAATAVIAWVIGAYWQAADSPWLWTPPFWGRWAAVLLMPVALWLVAVRLMRPPGEGRGGLYRWLPAPGSAGILIWAGLHLLNVGQARTVMLFAAFAAIALFALVKNIVLAPPAAVNAPAGRIGFAPAVAALLVWAALLALHPLVIGVDPLAGLDAGLW